MERFSIWLAGLCSFWVSGCSDTTPSKLEPDFWDISADEIVNVWIEGLDTFVDGTTVYNASLNACFSTDADPNRCGRRYTHNRPKDEIVVAETTPDVEDRGRLVVCDDEPDMQDPILEIYTSRCHVRLLDAVPLEEFDITINGQKASVAMPSTPTFELTSPIDADQVDVSGGIGVIIKWNMSADAAKISWKIENTSLLDMCINADWSKAHYDEEIDGPEPDDGELTVPVNRLPPPQDLPSEGCEANVTAYRYTTGTMPATISGLITGRQTKTVGVKIYPMMPPP